MASGPTRIEEDGLGDWRFQAVARVAQDVPPAYPGGPAHKAGSLICLSTSTPAGKDGIITFPTPNVTALALEIGFQAATCAISLRKDLIFREAPSPMGPTKIIGRLSMLYEYFEQCMISVSFSFQAVETFANTTIVSKLSGSITLERRRGPETLTAEEIERKVATEEKLASILPEILKKESPKGTHEWQRFMSLKDARDATIHLKAKDQYPPEGQMDETSLFFRFLTGDVHEFPRAALAMISYFCGEGGDQPRWLAHLTEKFGAKPT